MDFLESRLVPYPVLVNHELVYNHAKSVGDRLLGAVNVQLFTPPMGAENLSYFLQKIPAAMLVRGVGNEAMGQVHSSLNFFASEEALPIKILNFNIVLAYRK